MHTLILGAGFSGLSIAELALEHGTVCGTRRSDEGIAQLKRLGIPACQVEGEVNDCLIEQLLKVTHLVISVAPGRDLPLDDPMLSLLQPLAGSTPEQSSGRHWPELQWIGYLSTIGVYGDHDGRWIDEESPCISRQRRSLARHAAEQAWQSFGHQIGVPVSILRLSGIYGPGRNAVADALAGRARMLIKPGQVFNRIHVHDLAQATILAALQRFQGVLNITDDEPAPPQDVIRYAHSLLGLSPPEPQDFASAELSPMARSFYSENKRVSNQRSRSLLGLQYRYPNYRAGLEQLHESLER